MAIGSLQEIVVDCANPIALARFWQALIGGDVVEENDEWVWLEDDDFVLAFQLVPERKQGKNRLHLDVDVDDLDPAIDEAEQLGARKIGGIVDGDIGTFQVMADPEGNEFCFITG
jgi:hypothetical protein